MKNYIIKEHKMKEKALKIILSVLYSKISYTVTGNKCVLASNKLLSEVKIDDIDMICELAKCIEENTKTEINEEKFSIVYDKFNELIKRYLNE
jgi:hypothetical protein